MAPSGRSRHRLKISRSVTILCHVKEHQRPSRNGTQGFPLIRLFSKTRETNDSVCNSRLTCLSFEGHNHAKCRTIKMHINRRDAAGGGELVGHERDGATFAARVIVDTAGCRQ